MPNINESIKSPRVHLAVATVAFLAYLPALSGGFAWDTLNVFAGESLFVPSPDILMHRPMFKSFLDIQYMLWADNALLYHLFNSLVHAANAVLVFLLSIKLLEGNRAAALIAALVFALHPAASVGRRLPSI